MNITPAAGNEKVKQGALLVDVRTPAEFSTGHVSGALNISHDELDRRIAELGEDRSREIVFYCKAGRRAEYAQTVAAKHGFTAGYAAGAYSDWLKL